MDDKTIFSLTKEGNSIIDSNVDIMNKWLINLNKEDLLIFYRMCNKDIQERSDLEKYEICRYSIVLYCRELGLSELAISNELIYNLSNKFCTNIIFESLRRRGFAKCDNPIYLYKENNIELTDSGQTFFNSQNKE